MLPLLGLDPDDEWGADLNAILTEMRGDDFNVPSSPNARDDEFDGSSTATWVNNPTAPTEWTVDGTFPGSLYLRTSALAAKVVGKHQTIPTATALTIQTGLVDCSVRQNFQTAGISIGPAAPTASSAQVFFGIKWNSAIRVGHAVTTYDGAFNTEDMATYAGYPPVHLRVQIATNGVLTFAYKPMGTRFWRSAGARTPSFTPAVVGLVVGDENANSGVEAVFDYFRVTT